MHCPYMMSYCRCSDSCAQDAPSALPMIPRAPPEVAPIAAPLPALPAAAPIPAPSPAPSAAPRNALPTAWLLAAATAGDILHSSVFLAGGLIGVEPVKRLVRP